jgi:hypothetical protein
VHNVQSSVLPMPGWSRMMHRNSTENNKGVRYYEERPRINRPPHGTSSVKESSLFFLKGA